MDKTKRVLNVTTLAFSDNFSVQFWLNSSLILKLFDTQGTSEGQNLIQICSRMTNSYMRNGEGRTMQGHEVAFFEETQMRREQILMSLEQVV